VTAAPVPEPPLAAAARRLRRSPGRPRTVTTGENLGCFIQSAPLAPASGAGMPRDFAQTLLPRGLSVRAASAYSGLAERALWRLIAAGRLAPIRIPGTRRLLLDRLDLDALLEACKKTGEEERT
jgi:hypothetical protein